MLQGSGITGMGEGGTVPPDIFHREIFADYYKQEKRGFKKKNVM